MRKLNIEITKAQLKGFSVKFDPDKDHPEISATIALITDHGKEITEYTIFTDCWSENQKFDLPISMFKPIFDIGQELEVICVRHCREGQLALENKKS